MIFSLFELRFLSIECTSHMDAFTMKKYLSELPYDCEIENLKCIVIEIEC